MVEVAAIKDTSFRDRHRGAFTQRDVLPGSCSLG